MPQASMADEALKSLEDLLENVPAWITDLESILKTSAERQKEILFENQPAGTPVWLSRKPSKSSSLLSRRSIDNEQDESEDAAPNQAHGEDVLLRPQLPHMTQSDALRLSQRKRKTTSALSDQSGPPKFRSKGMVVVYYDGDTQKQFETLVRAIGGNRNALRKAKMSAKVDSLSRTGSGSSSEASSSEDQVTVLPSKLQYKTTRAIRVTSNPVSNDGTTQAFDLLDELLEKAQALCEKAAHQVLRDGDCALEMRAAREHVVELQKVAEGELPSLQKRAEKSLERRKRERDREKAGVAAQAEKESSTPPSVTEKAMNPFSSPASLEVDLEADDSEEDEDIDFEVGAMQLGKFGIRSTRATAVSAS